MMFRKIVLTFWCLVLLSISSHASDLAEKFSRLSCAVIHFEADGSSGTGVFIDADGHVLTAAHVALDRSYDVVSPKDFTEHIVMKSNAKITQIDGTVTSLPPQSFQKDDLVNATTDLAILSTGVKTNCFLKTKTSIDDLKVGSRLIAIGFPASAPTGVLYEGFLSSKYSAMHVLGPVSNGPGKSVQNTYDVLRVQMPVAPGASGSPVIAEDDTIVWVMSEIPVAALADVQKIIQTYLSNQGPSSGVFIGGFDTNRILAEVAFIVQEYESPGSGLAIPISYLHRAQ
jgi:V8-like Glu-specific endopeptidase